MLREIHRPGTHRTPAPGALLHFSDLFICKEKTNQELELEETWEAVSQAVTQALDVLDRMRLTEGAALATDLAGQPFGHPPAQEVHLVGVARAPDRAQEHLVGERPAAGHRERLQEVELRRRQAHLVAGHRDDRRGRSIGAGRPRSRPRRRAAARRRSARQRARSSPENGFVT